MKIVLTHQNPDFDALSSAYAALKLYNCDQIITCSSIEENIRNFFETKNLEIPIINFSEKDLKNFNEKIELIVITDCKTNSRLGILAELINKTEKLIIYDHHPESPHDIKPNELYLEQIGSTTTMLVEKLFDTNIRFSIDEYTFFLLAIYEDTGFLSFSNTQPRDLYAAAMLLEKGAQITAVKEFVKHEMSKQHIFLLNELLLNMQLYSIKGLHIGLSYASIDEYLNDISVLAHKIMDIENLDALFIAVRSGYRIIVIGRSSNTYVNTAEILSSLGGGGHPTASSCIVKDMTLNETYDKLVTLVKEYVKPMIYVKEFMTSPVKFVTTDQTFDDAFNEFMKYNLNMLPVVNDGKTTGLIARKDILQGLKHGLSSEPVSSIMQIEFETISPDASFLEVQDIILGKNQKLIPVEKNGKLVGVVTRTDLLRLLSEEISRSSKNKLERIKNVQNYGFRNIKNLIHERIPETYYKMLCEIGQLAEKHNMNAYLVGGFVRDIIMRQPNLDIDIVVEGDATILAKYYAEIIDAKVAIHHKYKTATVKLKNNFSIDFATSRTEYYNLPAATPEVENSSIKNDLYRRDFSINAMAVKINSTNFGELLDFFGGQKDIKDKKIRVLHNLSFVDDPSRCFRAIRFAVRYGFDIGPHTHKLLKHAVSLNLFDRVLGSRLFTELKYILSEDSYLQGINKLCEYNMLKFFSKKIKITEDKYKKFNTLDKISHWYSVQCENKIEIWICRFSILFSELKFKDIIQLSDRLDFSTEYRKEFTRNFFRARRVVFKIVRTKDITPYFIYECFKSFKDEFILIIGAILGEDYEYMIKDYFTKISKINLEISGKDLIELGFKPSIKFGKILNEILKMKINGEIFTKEEELEIAVKLMKKDTQ